MDRVKIKKVTNETPFELWYGHSPNVKHLKVFGCKCYILKKFRNGKFDAKSDGAYSLNTPLEVKLISV